ncbi:hypothetical protein L1987_78343 [Smallanthus sonchifolius]|uniref:Uncharacterized protein n=1 Tax=Smallanthus sonchifolius TaxID=185202 RepID=A0ACB8ZBH0_9ASTR|nr:hypothetical protein L1987_78343 [Smallanthus sonchifolius]
MLWNSFRHLPNMSDAFVPRKKDRRGNIFGYIRFKSVKNVDYLINEVMKVRVGSAKIGVNTSKFSRNNHPDPSTSSAKPSHHSRPQPEHNYMPLPQYNNEGNKFGGKSFKAALAGKVLLTFKSEEEMQSFMKEEEKIHGKFFKVAWLTIRGVPMHLWEPEVFNTTGSKLGMIILGSTASEMDCNLSYDRIAILTKKLGSPSACLITQQVQNRRCRFRVVRARKLVAGVRRTATLVEVILQTKRLDLNSAPISPACHIENEEELNCLTQIGDNIRHQENNSSTIPHQENVRGQNKENSNPSNGLTEEIGDTIKMGGTIGVNMEGFENHVIEEINGKGVHIGYQ